MEAETQTQTQNQESSEGYNVSTIEKIRFEILNILSENKRRNNIGHPIVSTIGGINKNLEIDKKVFPCPILIYLCTIGNIDITKLLLDNGANINIKSIGFSNRTTVPHNGGTAIGCASYMGNYEIVKLLLENGADPNITNFMGKNALYFAITKPGKQSKPIVKLLLEYKAVIFYDYIGDSPLHAAVRMNKVSIVKIIVKYYIDNKIKIKNSDMNNCILCAIKKKHKSIAILLINNTNELDNLLLPEAIRSCCIPIIELLISKSVKIYDSYLVIACRTGNMETIKTMLNNVKNPNKCINDDNEIEPYIDNNYMNLTPLITYINYFMNSEVIELLIKNGADPNQVIFINNPRITISPLICAVMYNNLPAIKILLKHGVNPNYMDSSKKTAINYCFTKPIISISNSIINLLLDNGADINFVKDDDNFLINVIEYGNGDSSIVLRLLDLGMNPNKYSNSEVKEYIDSPISTAIKNEYFDIINVLLDKGADPNIQNNDPNRYCLSSPLYNAISTNKKIIKLLLDYGANINQTCNIYQLHLINNPNNIRVYASLLFRACQVNIDIFIYLLERGINPNDNIIYSRIHDDNNDWTNIKSLSNIIIKYKRYEYLKVLIKYGATFNFKTYINYDPALDIIIDKIKDLTLFERAVAFRRHDYILNMLQIGEITTKGSSYQKTLQVINYPPNYIWNETPGPCILTNILARMAIKCWSPSRHFLYTKEFKKSVHTVILVVERLQRHSKSITSKTNKFALMPNELWWNICSFFLRDDWKVS